jgi:hypothetical protein
MGLKFHFIYWNDLNMVFIVRAYQISQYVVLRGSIFLGKWRSYFAGGSDGKMIVQSSSDLNAPCIVMDLLKPLLSNYSVNTLEATNTQQQGAQC